MLLGLSREEAQLRPAALAPVLEQLKTSLGTLPGGVLLTVQGDTALTVLAQPDLLLVLLRNLVQNAARAKPKDGCVRLECALCAAEERLRIAVRDTGCGIPPQDLPHVTQAFYMVDKSRARSGGGSGIGLALCERIAALHGSPLTIESVVDEGTTVCFTLPLATYAPQNEKGVADDEE
jgi:signal transduction histidine kinase